MKRNLFLIFSLVLSVCFMSCDDDDPEIPNTEELVTTFTYSLMPEGGGDLVTLSFVDLDGDGGGAPEVSGGTLAANTNYVGTILLLNQLESPAENVTLEVAEEDDDHQFFFQSTLGDVMVDYQDQDDNGNPLGISTILRTGDVGSGVLTVTLRHFPDKFAPSVFEGNIDDAGGETEVEAIIPFDVQ